MDEQVRQRAEEMVREMNRRGELINPGSKQNDNNDTSLRYSLRDIPTYDGTGDSMPNIHMIEFNDFLVNTGSKLHELPQEPQDQDIDREYNETVVRNAVSKFKASLKAKPRLWFEIQYPIAEDEPKTRHEYDNMVSVFITEHNPIGTTREQVIMAWKNLKWDPATEMIDDFVYKFRRIAKELGYNADQSLETFICCVPSHFYLYLRDATTIKEAMDNIKKACTLGGVSAHHAPAPTVTNTGPVIPFMQMKDQQNPKQIHFQEDNEMDDDYQKLKIIIENSNQMLEGVRTSIEDLIHKVEYQFKDTRSRNRDKDKRKDRRDSHDSSDERSRSRDRSRSRGRSSKKCDYCHKPNHDLSHCYRLVKDLNKLYSTTERNGDRDEDEQGRLQMSVTIKNYFESRKDSTN